MGCGSARGGANPDSRAAPETVGSGCGPDLQGTNEQDRGAAVINCVGVALAVAKCVLSAPGVAPM
eukprot:2009595-Lingulodinium_polyedra.AAC.1